jgi:hypothetical protein
MKKSELKKLLKPMIRECIKEVIFEEGVLSGIVSEVASGLGKPTLIESKRSHSSREVAEDNRITKQQVALAKRREDLLSSINKDAYGGVDLFEGTSPLSQGGSVDTGPSTQGPLANIEPRRPRCRYIWILVGTSPVIPLGSAHEIMESK